MNEDISALLTAVVVIDMLLIFFIVLPFISWLFCKILGAETKSLRERYKSGFEAFTESYVGRIIVGITLIVEIFLIVRTILCSTGRYAYPGSFFEPDTYSFKVSATVEYSSLPKFTRGAGEATATIEYVEGEYYVLDITNCYYDETVDTSYIEDSISFGEEVELYLNDKNYEDELHLKVVFDNTVLELISEIPVNWVNLISASVVALYILILFIYDIYQNISSRRKGKESAVKENNLSKKLNILIGAVIALCVCVIVLICVLIFGGKSSTDSTKVSEGELPYLMNSETKIVHYSDCYTIKDKDNYSKTYDLQKALKRGYEPCEICQPEEKTTEED